ncbi:hypothetical protein B0T19DRAFT_434084 [Cercophora scortea]|uniref:Uncharacterized protein n=1 Tax=Cercophora scortea TaxID=314031 RepID=A0AAE0I7U6_9PEZI|nr:hypothetical protein B0T19DRAFT_434084 [Cercophora scortea]
MLKRPTSSCPNSLLFHFILASQLHNHHDPAPAEEDHRNSCRESRTVLAPNMSVLSPTFFETLWQALGSFQKKHCQSSLRVSACPPPEEKRITFFSRLDPRMHFIYDNLSLVLQHIESDPGASESIVSNLPHPLDRTAKLIPIKSALLATRQRATKREDDGYIRYSVNNQHELCALRNGYAD